MNTDEAMREFERIIHSNSQVKSILIQWASAKGHDRCWHHPEILKNLCKIMQVPVDQTDPCLPERADFRRGCQLFEDQQYGKVTGVIKTYDLFRHCHAIDFFKKPWQLQCEVISDWQPKFAQKPTVLKYVVRWRRTDSEAFLRHSNGPSQGFFWDVYPDDMHNIALCIKAIENAPHPNGWDTGRADL